MGILTNFLKLLKPEENDYYNAITEQAENWQKVDNWAKGIDDSNKKKLDKGNVSVEYDTAKKIEDKIKEVKDTADGKVSKSGDTMTGRLSIKGVNESIYILNADGSRAGILGRNYTNNGIYMYNDKARTLISLNDDGTTRIDASNLNTKAKSVIEAINSYGFIDYINDKNTSYFDTLTTPGVYQINNSNIFTNVYQWGILIVYVSPTGTIFQEYIADNDSHSTYIRSKYSNTHEWSKWSIIGGSYKKVATLTQIGQSYTIQQEVFRLLVNAYDATGMLSTSYIFDNKSIKDFNRIRKFNFGQQPNYEYDITVENNTLTLVDRGIAKDAEIYIYII